MGDGEKFRGEIGTPTGVVSRQELEWRVEDGGSRGWWIVDDVVCGRAVGAVGGAPFRVEERIVRGNSEGAPGPGRRGLVSNPGGNRSEGKDSLPAAGCRRPREDSLHLSRAGEGVPRCARDKRESLPKSGTGSVSAAVGLNVGRNGEEEREQSQLRASICTVDVGGRRPRHLHTLSIEQVLSEVEFSNSTFFAAGRQRHVEI